MANRTRGQKRIHDYIVTEENDENIANEANTTNGNTHFIVIHTTIYSFYTTIYLFVLKRNFEDNEGNSNQLMAKRQKTSLPRLLDGKYFEVLNSDWPSSQRIEARCQTCAKIRKGDIRSTGNFMDHYRSCHPTLAVAVEKYRKQKDSSDSSPFLKQTTLSPVLPLNSESVSLNLRIFINDELTCFLFLSCLKHC